MESFSPPLPDLPAIPRLVFTDLVPVLTRPFWVDLGNIDYDTRQIPTQLAIGNRTGRGIMNDIACPECGFQRRALSERPTDPFLAETLEPAFGKWQDLPGEIVDLMLEFMLVSEEPITNPWAQRMRTTKTEYRNEDESGDATGSNVSATNNQSSISQNKSYKKVVVQYSWSKYLRPALLATCKEYHKKGTNLLYGLNTFQFTRLMGQLGQDDWSIFVGGKTVKNTDAFSEFLCFKHKSLLSLYPEMTHSPMRLHLIRKLFLEDSDVEGTSKFNLGSKLQGTQYREYLNDKLSWQFYMVNRLEAWGACLNQLVLTFDDQDEPVVSQHLRFETEVRKMRRIPFESQTRHLTPDGCFARRERQEMFYSPRWNIVEPWGAPDTIVDNSWTRRWVVVDRLIVRGASQLNQNALRTYLQVRLLMLSMSRPFLDLLCTT